MSPPGVTRAELALLLALVAIGAAIRLATLGGESLWYDEAAMYQLVQGDWRAILAANATGNSSPPLFPLLLGLVTGPGAGEAALRAPAALAGIAGIPLAWAVARQFTPTRWALLAALLVALSPTQIEYSQEVREYSLAFAAACAMILAWARLLDAPDAARAAWVALAGAAGLAVQYGNALLVAGLDLVAVGTLLATRAPPRAWRLWLASQLPVAATAVALFVTTIRPQLEVSVVSGGRYVYLAERYWDGTAGGLATLLASPESDIVHFAFPGKLMLALVAAGAVAAMLRPGARRALALLVAPVAVAVAAAMAGAYPFGAVRQDMFLLPPVYGCAALGLAALVDVAGRAPLRRAAPGLAAVVAALVVAGLAWTGATRAAALARYSGNEPMRPVVAELAARLDPGERIYVYWGAVPAFRYYWRDRPEPWIVGAVHWSGIDGDGTGAALAAVEAELVALLADPAPFWLVMSHMDSDDAAALLSPVEARAAVNVTISRNGTALFRVTPRRFTPAPADAPPPP